MYNSVDKKVLIFARPLEKGLWRALEDLFNPVREFDMLGLEAKGVLHRDHVGVYESFGETVALEILFVHLGVVYR